MQNKNFNDDESDTKLSINSEANSWLWPTASVDQKAEDSSILSGIILEKGVKKKNEMEERNMYWKYFSYQPKKKRYMLFGRLEFLSPTLQN